MNRHDRRKQEAQARKPYLYRFEPSPPPKQDVIAPNLICGCSKGAHLNYNPYNHTATCEKCGFTVDVYYP